MRRLFAVSDIHGHFTALDAATVRSKKINVLVIDEKIGG